MCPHTTVPVSSYYYIQHPFYPTNQVVGLVKAITSQGHGGGRGGMMGGMASGTLSMMKGAMKVLDDTGIYMYVYISYIYILHIYLYMVFVYICIMYLYIYMVFVYICIMYNVVYIYEYIFEYDERNHEALRPYKFFLFWPYRCSLVLLFEYDEEKALKPAGVAGVV